MAFRAAAESERETMIDGQNAKLSDLPLRERKKLRMRQDILDVGARLFLEKGYSATTLKDVAEATQTSIATIVRYFETKEQILLQHEYRALETLRRKIAATAYDSMADGLRDFLTLARENVPARARLLDAAFGDPAGIQAIAAMHAENAAIMEGFFRRFLPASRAGKLRAKALAGMWVSIGKASLEFWHEDGGRPNLVALQEGLVNEFIAAFAR